MNNFNKEEYLKRINFEGEISINFESLKALHRAQHLAIPFENFDICLGRNIQIDSKSIFQKLVRQKRGGYCFELNGLLVMALKAFGFDARPLLGRVHLSREITGRTHQTTLVTIDNKSWIVDLGFGAEAPLIPIPLVYNEPISFENQSYRLVNDEVYGYILQSNSKGHWKNLYSFDLNPVFEIDIKLGNHYTSTHPDSFFTNARIAALPIENGMISLYHNKLKKTINGKEEITTLKDDSSYLDVLEQEFGIELDAEYGELKRLR
ncbi:arylamine N-acetyltransferase family protein [Brumimicrobium oceani]|uniref:N-hydroxyarylamine O-acetyltransferase n=1 Tax=Brumimicrobium oceani TaxID=2100725 RepID=A0A2U2XCS3_9FLAO|nr:arylamine N-acetyltransferase [Brumimicrobium oceani]PWH85596.1 N-hydroxyarylamine O-acetyltransferase [Brumimicrobium oceani]